MNDLELEREKNAKELEELLATALQDPDLKEFLQSGHEAQNKFSIFPKVAKKRKRHDEDDVVRFSTKIPNEIRKSSRLLKKPPIYSYTDLKDDEDYDPNSDSDIENLETVVFPRQRKRVGSKRAAPFVIVPVESITDSYIANVAKRETIKQYSAKGTSCHQCRQKTLDSKTYCRNANCIGVRGQFCGPCLINRYGEDAVQVLHDPKWKCPPCRGICNCSICRTREGKRPTGILAPLAFRCGHNSVKDFLLSLNGKGDFKKQLVKAQESEDEGDLLGFTADDERKGVMWKHSPDEEDLFLLGFEDGKPVTVSKPV